MFGGGGVFGALLIVIVMGFCSWIGYEIFIMRGRKKMMQDYINKKEKSIQRKAVIQREILTRSRYQGLKEAVEDEWESFRGCATEKEIVTAVMRKHKIGWHDAERVVEDILIEDGWELEKYSGQSDAVEGENVYHDHDVDAPEYTYDEIPVQMRRAANRVSMKKTFKTSVSDTYEDVSYKTDSKGGIDFDAPYEKIEWKSPIGGSIVSLEAGPDYPDYGVLQNNNLVNIRAASRRQHFDMANKIAGESGDKSPANYTWHHLLEYPKMVLVDSKVHAKYGHNGGFLLW